MLTLKVKNLSVLRDVEIELDGLSVLIGANGSGKTTLLQCLRLIECLSAGRWDFSFVTAFPGQTCGSIQGWEKVGAPTIILSEGMFQWTIIFPAYAWEEPYEELLYDGELVAKSYQGHVGPCTVLGLLSKEAEVGFHGYGLVHRLTSSGYAHPALSWFSNLALHTTSVEHDKLPTSPELEDNLFSIANSNPMLFEVVSRVLSNTFPSMVQGLDRTGRKFRDPIVVLRTGGVSAIKTFPKSFHWVVELILRANLVTAGGVLVVDDFGSNLHPSAVYVLIEWLNQYVPHRGGRVLLLTHNPCTLLSAVEENALGEVWALGLPEGPQAVRLTDAFLPEWLMGMGVPSLFMHCNLGSNRR